MARAETMEGVCAAAAGGASGPLPPYHHSSFTAWPNTQHPHIPPLPASLPRHLLPGPTPQTPSPPLSTAQSDERRHQVALHRRRPLPDLLPQDEHESADPLPATWLDATAVGEQLRTIGDDFNASVLQAQQPTDCDNVSSARRPPLAVLERLPPRLPQPGPRTRQAGIARRLPSREHITNLHSASLFCWFRLQPTRAACGFLFFFCQL
ncbi:bcl-2-binding component 3 isoform X2 [Dunckerocampus dactyliophorus]|nr:bcl-2-binding component 3 isoform X2 [Dunckerocampus dactyliophorus]